MKEKKNNIFIVLAVPVVIFLILTACIDNYGFHSLKIVLSQAIIPTTLGYAMCFTNAIGMFDLSCASAMIIAAMIGGSLGNTMGIPGLIIGCIAVGVVLGVINGTVYKLLKIPCLIVSLGLLLIYEILAQKIGLGVSKTIPADVGIIGKFPYSLIILGASALLFYYIYNKTCIACHIRAVGNEELLANALGVNAMNTKYMTFVLAGIFIGITAILQISYANSITTVSSLRSISMIFQPLLLIYEILAQKIGLGVSKTIPADVGIIGKFPYSLIILGASALLFYYIYNKTCIACHIRAVGNEELLANALGVNAMNTKYMTFVLAGIFIGITAILQISYANSITTVSSLRSISMIFQPLMGVLIAFAIQEWCNLTLGVFISQFTLSMMFNALIALGVPSKMQDVVLGVMLIIVMGIALNNKRISGFFERKARRKELMKRA